MAMASASRAHAAAALAEQTLSASGRLRLRATGASMLPALQPGDELHFVACAAEQLEPGEIVLCRRGERLFAHRVIARDGEQLHTQGDALAEGDPPFHPTEVLGRLHGFHRRARWHATAPRRGWGAGLLRRSAFLTRMYLRWLRATQLPSA